MRFSLSLLAALACAAPIAAQTVEESRAKAALALASLHRTAKSETKIPCCECAKCDCQICDCALDASKAKAMLSLACAQRERESCACLDDVAKALGKATRENKWLFVWVDITCADEPHIRDAFGNSVHCHAKSLNGITEPRLLVGPYGPQSLYLKFVKSDLDKLDAPKKILEKIDSVYQPAPVVQETSFAPSAGRAASC